MLVIDGHIDFTYHLEQALPGGRLGELVAGHLTPRALDAGGLRVAVSALFVPDRACGPGRGPAYLDSQFDIAVTRLDMPLVRTRQDLAWALAAPGGRYQILLVENADPLLDADLDELFERGLRLVGLTHVGGNRLASGNADPAPKGLTSAGRGLLRKLGAKGFILDVAHLHPLGFDEALELFRGPVCCTHAGLRRFYDTPRNLTGNQIKKIAARQGVLGVTFAPEILREGSEASLETVYEVLDTAVQLGGIKAVGLGSDFGGYDFDCQGLPDASSYPRLFERLARAGYPEGHIEAIAHGNWRRFFEDALPEEGKGAGQKRFAPGDFVLPAF